MTFKLTFTDTLTVIISPSDIIITGIIAGIWLNFTLSIPMSPQFISRSALLPDDVAFVILTIVDCHFPFAVLYVKRSVIGIVRMLDMLIFLIPSTTHGAKVLSSSSAVIAFFCMTRPVIISSAKMLSSFNDSSAIWDAVIVLSAIFAAVIFFAPTVGLGYVPARSPPAISGIKSITLPKTL